MRKTVGLLTMTVAPTSGESWNEKYEATQDRVAATLDLRDLSRNERAFLPTCPRIN
jgi:hypothetical protein